MALIRVTLLTDHKRHQLFNAKLRSGAPYTFSFELVNFCSISVAFARILMPLFHPIDVKMLEETSTVIDMNVDMKRLLHSPVIAAVQV